MAIPILKATHKDAEALTKLTLRSKAHWGYSEEQMEKWREDLTISEAYITENEVFALKEQGIILGYYSFFALSAYELKLDNLFVDPNHMGMGFGNQLMSHFLQEAKKMGFEKIRLDADPHAESFYCRFNFKTIGHLESSIQARTLPIMELSI